MPKKASTDKKTQKSSRTSVTIDFPQEKEKIRPGHYAVRITAPEHGVVELSVNEGQWLLCRSAAGYYWCDWYPEETGSVKLIARIKSGKSPWTQSPVRSFVVKN